MQTLKSNNFIPNFLKFEKVDWEYIYIYIHIYIYWDESNKIPYEYVFSYK